MNTFHNKCMFICLKWITTILNACLYVFKHVMCPKQSFFLNIHFVETFFSLLAFKTHFCFPWEGQGKDIVLTSFCGQHLVYWGKKTSTHPQWHFELCLRSPDLLFYCNGIALQPVPAYWVLRLSPLQFKQVWHSDKLFSFVLGHKSRSPKI